MSCYEHPSGVFRRECELKEEIRRWERDFGALQNDHEAALEANERLRESLGGLMDCVGYLPTAKRAEEMEAAWNKARAELSEPGCGQQPQKWGAEGAAKRPSTPGSESSSDWVPEAPIEKRFGGGDQFQSRPARGSESSSDPTWKHSIYCAVGNGEMCNCQPSDEELLQELLAHRRSFTGVWDVRVNGALERLIERS